MIPQYVKTLILAGRKTVSTLDKPGYKSGGIKQMWTVVSKQDIGLGGFIYEIETLNGKTIKVMSDSGNFYKI